jgi:hypothetical protein
MRAWFDRSSRASCLSSGRERPSSAVSTAVTAANSCCTSVTTGRLRRRGDDPVTGLAVFHWMASATLTGLAVHAFLLREARRVLATRAAVSFCSRTEVIREPSHPHKMRAHAEACGRSAHKPAHAGRRRRFVRDMIGCLHFRRASTSSGFTGKAWFPQLLRSWLRTAATSSSVSWSANAGMADA